jgi:hypothetical protein
MPKVRGKYENSQKKSTIKWYGGVLKVSILGIDTYNIDCHARPPCPTAANKACRCESGSCRMKQSPSIKSR